MSRKTIFVLAERQRSKQFLGTEWRKQSKEMAELDSSKKVANRCLKRQKLGEGTYGVVYEAIDAKNHLAWNRWFFRNSGNTNTTKISTEYSSSQQVGEACFQVNLVFL